MSEQGVEREHNDGCMTEFTWDEDDCNCRPAWRDCGQHPCITCDPRRVRASDGSES